jgi:hypothetical protein
MTRHDILADERFWLTLEFDLSGWFRTCADPAFGGFWCDGFVPHAARNTRSGIVVEGAAWIVDERTGQRQYAFTVEIPQRMLSRRRDRFVLTVIAIDVARGLLQLAVAPGASA